MISVVTPPGQTTQCVHCASRENMTVLDVDVVGNVKYRLFLCVRCLQMLAATIVPHLTNLHKKES